MVRKGVALDLEALRKELQSAKDNERPDRNPSIREAVGVLLPEIEGLRKAKWSDAQISEWLGKRGLAISPGTLAQYVREARRTANATEGKKSPKATTNISPASSMPKHEPETKPTPSSAKVEPVKEATRTPETVGIPSGVRSPNATAAIPTKRKINDDA